MGQINAPYGANTKNIVVGRGYGAKRGNKSGRGTKGQNSRSGGGVRPGFEGGQMPLYRRLARRGFSNADFKVVYEVVSLDAIDANFEAGETVTLEALKARGVVKGKNALAKILCNGELTKKVDFEGIKVSAAAVKAIEAVGGSVK